MNPINSLSSNNTSIAPATDGDTRAARTAPASGPTVTPSQTASPFDATSGGRQPDYPIANPPAYTAGENPSEPSIQAPLLVPFSSPEDQQAFDARQSRLLDHEAPNARNVAKDFIMQNLGVDGDQYVVAHFEDEHSRAAGMPDRAFTLTEAVMQNFPDFRNRGVIPHLSREIGFYSTAGVNPSDEIRGMFHSKSAGDFFAKLGTFVVNRTGPGFLYNLVRNKNPAKEATRTVDESFGIYKKSETGEQTYTDKNRYELNPSEVYEKFKAGELTQVPYLSKLWGEFDAFWNKEKGDWPSVMRHHFLEDARTALNNGDLTNDEFKMVMKGAVPQLALKPPYTLKQLDQTSPPDPSVKVARFDINGYPAMNILRFIGPDQKEVMYVPGNEPPFVTFHNDKERTDWVIAQGKDPQKSAQLLRHFSIYNRQDGTFRSGVESALNGLADGTWAPDGGYVDKDNQLIDNDVFQDMRQQVENRMREDSSMQTRTAGEAWMDTLDMWSMLFFVGPAKTLPAALAVGHWLQIGTQLGTSTMRAFNGKTYDEREDAFFYSAFLAGSALPFHSIGAKRGVAKTPTTDSEASPKQMETPSTHDDDYRAAT